MTAAAADLAGAGIRQPSQHCGAQALTDGPVVPGWQAGKRNAGGGQLLGLEVWQLRLQLEAHYSSCIF